MQFHSSRVSPREGPAETPFAAFFEIIPQGRQGQHLHDCHGVACFKPRQPRGRDRRVDGAHDQRGSHGRGGVIQDLAIRIHSQRLPAEAAHQRIQPAPQPVRSRLHCEHHTIQPDRLPRWKAEHRGNRADRRSRAPRGLQRAHRQCAARMDYRLPAQIYPARRNSLRNSRDLPIRHADPKDIRIEPRLFEQHYGSLTEPLPAILRRPNDHLQDRNSRL